MKTLRGVFYGGHDECIHCGEYVHRNAFLVSVSAQASKWASFYSFFWACFRKLRLFSEGLRHVISDIKTSTLVVSVGSLRIVTVRTY